MITATDSRTIVEGYIAAAQAGDEAALRASFTPGAIWHLDGALPISGTWRGRDAIVDDFLGAAMSYYEPGSVSLEVTSVTAEGERVVVEWTSRARTRRGEPYENHCIGVFTVRDGRIDDVREYMDTRYAHAVAFAA